MTVHDVPVARSWGVIDHTCPNCDWTGMSSRIQYRGEAASLLSRRAAAVCSPGRKPGVNLVLRSSPVRGERLAGICRTYGAHARKSRNPRACARGYITIAAPRLRSDALRALFWTAVVYDRPYFADSRWNARSQTAPTVLFG